MKLKLLSDPINAFGKVAGWLKTIVNLPKTERKTIGRTLYETHHLIDTTLNMMIIRLGDLLLQASDDEFLCKVDCRTHLAEGSTR